MRSLGKSMCIAAVLMAALVQVLAAQELRDIERGDRVRIRSPQVTGTHTVLENTGTHLTLRERPGVETSVPIGSVTRLDVSRGRSARKGAVRGALWGLGAAGAVSAACLATGGADGCGMIVWIMTPMWTGAGALLGAVIRAERWERVRLSP